MAGAADLILVDMVDGIHYRDLRNPIYHRRYKYRLEHAYEMDTGIKPGQRLALPGDFVVLERDGCIRIKAMYAWDGPSGPTRDTPNFMRGSLVHDALYQLMREGLLSVRFRNAADRLLERTCIEDGMSKTRAARVYAGVKAFGLTYAKPRPEPPILVAPRRKR